MQSTEAIVDIETVADIPPMLLEKMRAKLKRRDDWKDEKKIAADLERKERKLVEDAALDPKTARIVIAGVSIREQFERAEWQHTVLVDRVGDERLLLEALDDLMYEGRVLRVITFGGSGFDMPVLIARSMIHQLALRFRWPATAPRRWHPFHTDMCDVLGGGSLEAWAITLFGQKKEHSGPQMADLIDEGRWDEAHDHCLWDIQKLAKIYDLYKETANIGR